MPVHEILLYSGTAGDKIEVPPSQLGKGKSSIRCSGLSSGETIAVEIPNTLQPDPDNDAHWEQAVEKSENVELTVDNKSIGIYAVTHFRLNIPTTANEVKVFLCR
jgi:hypothetical protein